MEERKATSDPQVQQPKNPKVSNTEWWIIGLAGFLVGLLMLVYDTRVAFGKLIANRGFWLSLANSVGCAWAIMTLVLLLTRWLDNAMPWRIHAARRFAVQLLLGMVLPGMVVLGWNLLFLACVDCLPLIERYLYQDFPFVLLWILVFNVLCVKVLRPPFSGWVGREDELPEDIRRDEQHDREEVIELANTVAFFVSEDKQTMAHGLDGSVAIDVRAVREIAEALKGDAFYHIRHGVVVNRRAIDRVYPDGRHFRMVLKPPHANRVFRTSKVHSTDFNAWWERREQV